MSDIVWLAALCFVALIVLGPQKLPEGIEALWLSLTNLRRSQQDLEPVDLEAVREEWRRQGSPILGIVQFLYAVSSLPENSSPSSFVPLSYSSPTSKSR